MAFRYARLGMNEGPVMAIVSDEVAEGGEP